MEEPSARTNGSHLTDFNGPRLGWVFPKGMESSILNLNQWTKIRRILHHRIAHFVFYDLAKVGTHIRTKLMFRARG